jgi:hypothetical protein
MLLWVSIGKRGAGGFESKLDAFSVVSEGNNLSRQAITLKVNSSSAVSFAGAAFTGCAIDTLELLNCPYMPKFTA